jgi:hypothetical protein
MTTATPLPTRSPPRRCAARLAVALVVALSCATGFAQPRYGLADDAYKAFTQWLNGSCIGDEEQKLRESLLKYRAPLALAFEKALADGPPAEELRAARAAAEARYTDRSRFAVDEAKIEGVSKEDLARFRRVSNEEYVNDQVRRFATGYRANAAAALAIVGGNEARALLTRIAGNKDDPAAPAAAEALKTMRRE